MTQFTYKKLVKSREGISVIGWLLIVINLCIGISTIIVSIITGYSLIANTKSIIAVFIIAMIVGILAAIDMIIVRTLRSYKVFRSN